MTLRPLLAMCLLGIWLPASVMASDIMHGRQLYQRHCQACHGSHGQPNMPGAPDFSRGERLLRSDEQVVAAIRRGQGMMPAFEGRFTADEFFDLVAFLRTLR